MIQSLIISELGIRHFKQAEIDLDHALAHRIIGTFELIPIIGLVISLFESIIAINYDPFFFRCDQYNSTGPTPPDRVRPILHRLQATRAEGIRFNERKIDSFLTGGACTSMAMTIASGYLRVGNFTFLSPAHATATEEDRIKQMAFNTIEVEAHTTVDIAKHKVQSLVSCDNLVIDHSSQQINILENNQNLYNEVTQLPTGTYLLRDLKPADNEKKEEHGHSMIYIKEENKQYLYEPNKGLMTIPNFAFLYTHLNHCYESWQTHLARFYRLIPV